ncbi:MAG: DUF2780 domain-containing protein [Thermoanaerobaculia bacterium]
MDELLRQLVNQLGTHPGQTEVGAGALLNLIREHASQVDFEQLLRTVPEASKWMGTAAAAQASPAAPGGDGGGGLLGELGGLIGGLTGSSGGVGGLISALAHSGLSADKLMQLVPMVLSLLQQRGGSDLVAKAAGSVPMLQEILGGGGAAGAGGAQPGGGILGELGKMFG